MQQYITVEEMANRLSISKKTAYEWVHSKDFPLIRKGKKFIRIGEADLEKWLKK